MQTDISSSPLMREAWAALGGELTDLDRVRVHGDATGLLPSRLQVTELVTASVAAATLAVSAFDAVRGTRRPAPVSLDARHVAAAATSERYARRPGSGLRAGMAPLSRFWRTADGWIRLHANYPWHRECALDVLGCDGEPEAVAAKVSQWNAAELEEALAAAGALGFAVRSLEQWGSHPQGAAVASQQLVQTTIGRGPIRHASRGRALAGIRVLDLTRVIAGPVATRTLAAWGAQVLRLDPPQLPEIPAQAIDTLPGKRSALLDLSGPRGRAQLEELLSDADLVISGYRPGALAKYGLDAASLAQRWPHISTVTVSAWGNSGPWSGRRGFDSLVQCPTGIAAIEGDGQVPGALPAQALDHATGYLAAAAAAMALAGSLTDGAPRSQEVSLARTARWLTGAGLAAPASPRQIDPGPYLTVVPGKGFSAVVIRPPGQLGDSRPQWRHTTELGADQPVFDRSE